MIRTFLFEVDSMKENKEEILIGENMKWLRAITVLPATVRHNANLKPLDKLIYSELLGLAGCWSTVFITKELKNDLAGLYTTTTRTINNSIANLIENGLLQRVKTEDDYYILNLR
jgi:hypothetical protein